MLFVGGFGYDWRRWDRNKKQGEFSAISIIKRFPTLK
jgi:hypothetical protein